MAETAKDAAGETPAVEKGRAKKKNTTEKAEKTEKVVRAEKVTRTRKAAKNSAAAVEEAEIVDKTNEAKVPEDDYLESIRDQIENCKNELSTSLQLSIADEYNTIVQQQLARAERRRRWNNFFHDVVIIAVVFVAVYFWCCLADAHYFSFMKSECERNNTCATQDATATETAGPVKDANWYLANYSYLFEDLKMGLNADDLAAYYLYSDDRKVSQIEPNYLLSMAYNRTNTTVTPDQSEITVTVDAMQKAFRSMFGSLDDYEAVDFDHGCLKFKFERSTQSFVAKNQTCDNSGRREIVEKIDKIYEEGEAIYILTTAAIYDQAEQNLYNFDNLFQPVVLNADADDISLYSANLNTYQYQFKKVDQDYRFASVTKLK